MHPLGGGATVYAVRMRVVRTWKGADAEEVVVRTATNSAACGVGFAVICAPEDAAAIASALRASGEEVFELGRVTDRPGVGIA